MRVDAAEEVTVLHLFVKTSEDIIDFECLLAGNHKNVSEIMFRCANVFKIPIQLESSHGIETDIQEILPLVGVHIPKLYYN